MIYVSIINNEYIVKFYMNFSWISQLLESARNNENISLDSLYSVTSSDESEELTDQLEK